jgi:hypothetical protein
MEEVATVTPHYALPRGRHRLVPPSHPRHESCTCRTARNLPWVLSSFELADERRNCSGAAVVVQPRRHRCQWRQLTLSCELHKLTGARQWSARGCYGHDSPHPVDGAEASPLPSYLGKLGRVVFGSVVDF